MLLRGGEKRRRTVPLPARRSGRGRIEGHRVVTRSTYAVRIYIWDTDNTYDLTCPRGSSLYCILTIGTERAEVTVSQELHALPRSSSKDKGESNMSSHLSKRGLNVAR